MVANIVSESRWPTSRSFGWNSLPANRPCHNRGKLCNFKGALWTVLLWAGWLAWVQAAPETKNYLVCVSNEKSGDVTLIDGGTQQTLSTIPVGKRPRGIHASPDGRWLFVALSGSPIGDSGHQGPGNGSENSDTAKPADHAEDGIAVVDLTSQKMTRKIPAGSNPEQFAISPDGQKLYIANQDASTVSVVNPETGKVENTIPVAGEPEGVAFSPDGKFVYVTCETRGEVFIIDAKKNKAVSHFTVGGRPRSVAFAPESLQAFVPSEASGMVHVFDCRQRKLIDQIFLPPNSRPMCLAMTGDGKKLYVSTGWGGAICVIDPGTDRVIDTIKVGSRPWGIALSPDGQKLYVANGPSNDVSTVDTRQGKEVARIQAGESPWGIAVTSADPPDAGPIWRATGRRGN